MTETMLTETPGHKRLKKSIKKILENSGFEFADTEVDIDTDGDNEPEFSIDVCAVHKKTLLVFQCKDRERIPGLKKEINSTQKYIQNVQDKNFRVIGSSSHFISDNVLKRIAEIKCCYAFTKKLAGVNTQKRIESAGFLFWDDKAVKYYARISNILRSITKHEILKEFDVKLAAKDTHEEDAVEIKQGDNSMYMLGIHPGLLLKMAYVYRRTSNKPNAYQRIITRDRIRNISKFFNESDDLMLPNPVIIVFDDSQKVQEKIRFRSNKLTFPTSYCSAWIIDGQHRIFGFKDHPRYKDWNMDDNDDFKIPVVVFDKLSPIKQNKAFVNINYYQKKIDAVLFNDLATIIQDLKHEITWPSLLVSELNKRDPWKGMIKVSEMDTKKPITISGFAKTKLLHTLLGYDKKTNTYSGNLYNVAKFDVAKPFSDRGNQEAFKKQASILVRFFGIIRNKVRDEDPEKDKWLNNKEFGLTRFTTVNALLLVLDKLLEKDLELNLDLDELLNAIDMVDFRNKELLKHGRGYPAMPLIANEMIKAMNKRYSVELNLV